MRTYCRHRLIGVLVVGVVLVVTSCQWSTFGFGPSRSGWNKAETIVSVDNVDQLQLAWSAPFHGRTAVAKGKVFATGHAISPPNLPRTLQAFDAGGVTGCSGSPAVCEPLWSAALPANVTLSRPTVSGDVVYLTATPFGGPPSELPQLHAFDANGVTGCSGTPKVCQPLWSAPGVSDAPLVDAGSVFVSDVNDVGVVLAYDAAGTVNCAGAPKTCAPKWRATLPCPDGCAEVGTMATDAKRLFVPAGNDIQEPTGNLFAFDKAGVEGCSGAPPMCSALASPQIGATAHVSVGSGLVVTTGRNAFTENPSYGAIDVFDPTLQRLWRQTYFHWIDPFVIGDGNAHKPAIDATRVYVPTSEGIFVYPLHPALCTGTPCQPEWRASSSSAQVLTVANGVLYDDFGRAFDAAGVVNCTTGPGRTCSPIATIGSAGAAPGTETQVVNGWVYRNVAAGIEAYRLPPG